MTRVAKREEQSSALVSLSERWGIESEKLIPITKATIFKADAGKVSDLELMAFLMVCAKYDLNPFLRQIHAFYDDKRKAVVPIVGVDGWVDLINREKRFEGMEFKEHSDANTGKLIAYTCRLYISGMRVPIEVTERLTECYRDTEPWRRMQHRMLRHKSLIQAGRYGFGISGIYDEDEGRDIVAGAAAPITEPLSLQEAQEVIHKVADAQAAREAPEPPGGVYVPETPTEEKDTPPEEQVQGTEGVDQPPGAPPADTEALAGDMLKTQVGNLVAKHGLIFSTADLTALDARLLLSKRSKAEVQRIVENIEKARTGMI